MKGGIKEILKQLTPEKVKSENKKILKIKLPPEIEKWVKEYEKVGKRNNYIWKWFYKKIVPAITLSEVPLRYRKSLWKSKFLMVMFVVLLDDVADNMKRKRLLDQLLKIPFEQKKLKKVF